MIGKQFKMKEVYGSGYHIEDCCGRYIWRLTSKAQAEELVELLNQLNDENEQLESIMLYLLKVIQDNVPEKYPTVKKIIQERY